MEDDSPMNNEDKKNQEISLEQPSASTVNQPPVEEALEMNEQHNDENNLLLVNEENDDQPSQEINLYHLATNQDEEDLSASNDEEEQTSDFEILDRPSTSESSNFSSIDEDRVLVAVKVEPLSQTSEQQNESSCVEQDDFRIEKQSQPDELYNSNRPTDDIPQTSQSVSINNDQEEIIQNQSTDNQSTFNIEKHSQSDDLFNLGHTSANLSQENEQDEVFNLVQSITNTVHQSQEVSNETAEIYSLDKRIKIEKMSQSEDAPFEYVHMEEQISKIEQLNQSRSSSFEFVNLDRPVNVDHREEMEVDEPMEVDQQSDFVSLDHPISSVSEPIANAQVIQIIENDKVVQVINMDQVITTQVDQQSNNNGVIQVINIEQVVENGEIIQVVNMDESSESQTENSNPNQPIIINIPPIDDPYDNPSSPPLSPMEPSSSQNLKRKNITEKQKHLIEFLHLENGLTAEQIRNHEKLRREDGSRILLKTIKYWLDRLKKTGEMQTKHRSGRPRFLDGDKEKKLLEYIDSHSKKNYQFVKLEKNLECTRRTINNYALRNGIKAYRALKKPSLNDFQKKRRLDFCEEWLLRQDDCKKIIFTDEKLFNGQPTNTHMLVRRRKGERFLEDNINHTLRPQLATSTNIWVYIGPFGKGEIFLAENDEYFDDEGNKIKKAKAGTSPFFNASSYRNLLEKRALPSIKERIDDFIFQQDNASIHCAKNESKTDTLVGELFKREEVTTMYWPPLSPDLNPVENVHHLLQVELNNELTRLEIKPKNKADVFALCKECWTRVNNDTVKKIYDSFYGRLQKVKDRQGSNNY